MTRIKNSHNIKYITLGLIMSLLNACSQIPLYTRLPSHPPAPTACKKVQVALVLGGGGVRGVAHAGVLEVLETAGIPIDLIVGCSAGSVIGAFYADNPNSKALRAKVCRVKKWEVFDPSFSNSLQMLWGLKGLMRGHALKNFLKKNLTARTFKDLKIPLCIVTTDINKAKIYSIRSGPLVPAIHASSAIPLAFEPIRMYNKLLVDGGVISPVPVDVARKYKPQVIIAVDIGTRPKAHTVTTNFDLLYKCIHVSYYTLSYWQTRSADFVIHPEVDDFGTFGSHASNDHDALYLAGKIAAIEALPKIRSALEKYNIRINPPSACAIQKSVSK